MNRLKYLGILFVLISPGVMAQGPQTLNLLPVPKEVRLHGGSLVIDAEFSISLQSPKHDTIMLKAVNRIYQSLSRRTGLYFSKEYIGFRDTSSTAPVVVRVQKPLLPSVGIDESYSLEVNEKQVVIDAPNTAGALHALQTLLQLCEKKGNRFSIPLVSIKDAPRFSWRGLMIDVSRHFIPVDVMKRNLEAMEAVKLNVLHLHCTDDQGFRIESKVFPQLHLKGSNGDYYTQAQVKELVAFAIERGIIIVPEFDMPGHSRSWFVGHPELSATPGPFEMGLPKEFRDLPLNDLGAIMRYVQSAPLPAMDPARESTYTFLDKLIGEMTGLFPAPYFHIGADEVNGVVWKNSPAIQDFMKKNKIANTHALQAYFVGRVEKLVMKYKKKMIGWEELFSKELSKDVTVQVWQNASYLKNALEHGNPVLLSRGFYLDLFMPAHVHYNNPDLTPATGEGSQGVLRGGEAAQWTEAADRFNIETRIWPRAGAVAERLWSATAVTDVDDMYRRLFQLSRQLDALGIRHTAAYENALRQFADEDDYTTLKTFTDLLSPIKGYKKLFARMTASSRSFQQTAPLVDVSDVIPVDSETKWKFRKEVRNFLANKDAASEKAIRNWLIRWKDNQDKLKELLANSDQLKKLEEHSNNLSIAATIGLEALDKIKAGNNPTTEWMNQCLGKLKAANQAHGETELSIVPEIESLVKQQMAALPATFPVF